MMRAFTICRITMRLSLCFLVARHVPAWQQVEIAREDSWDFVCDFKFLNDQDAWALISNLSSYRILKSHDAGVTWNPVSTGTCAIFPGEDLRSRLQPLSDTDAYLLLDPGGWKEVLLRTTDGGASWTSISRPFDDATQAFHFSTPDKGWVFGLNYSAPWTLCGLTEDGGDSWQTYPLPGGEFWVLDCCFLDDQSGWACGFGGRIVYTRNGGTSWSLAQAETPHDLHAIDFATASTGWAVGKGGTILFSNDGGSRWYRQLSDTSANLHDVQAISESQAIACGVMGDLAVVVSTNNGGATWNQENVALHNGLWAVDRAGGQVWTAGGGYSTGTVTMYHRALSAAQEPRPFIVVTATPRGTLGIQYETVFQAAGGAPPYHWSAGGALPPGLTLDADRGALHGVPAAAGNHSFDLIVTDSNARNDSRQTTVFIADEPLRLGPTDLPNATHRKTYQKALALTGKNRPFTFRVIDGAMPRGMTVDSQGVLAGTPFDLGAYAFTLEVTDSNCLPQRATQSYSLTVDPLTIGGWEIQYSCNRITDIHFFDDNQGIACGWSGLLYDTDDGGRCWRTRNPGMGQIWKFCWLGDEGWALSWSGVIHSSDRGQTWEIRNPHCLENEIQFVDPLRGWMASGGIRYTEDGGYNWSYVDGASSWFFTLGMKDARNGFAGGMDKTFFKTVDSGTTWTPAWLPWETLQGASDPPPNPSPNAAALAGQMRAAALHRSSEGRLMGIPPTARRPGDRGKPDVFAAQARGAGGSTLLNDQRIPDVNGVCFVGNTCWIGAQGNLSNLHRRMFKSYNGGQTWGKIELPCYDGNYDQIQFLPDALTGWATGLFNYRVLYTRDGGGTWGETEFRLITDYMSMMGLHFNDALTGWVAPNRVGRLWEPAGGDYIQIMDMEGGIYKSVNGGEAWDYQYGWPIREEHIDSSRLPEHDIMGPTFQFLQFFDEENGWAVGQGTFQGITGIWHKRLYYTNSGGARWDILSDNIQFNAFCFRSPTNGFAAAVPVLETTDGGRTWFPRYDITHEGTSGEPSGAGAFDYYAVRFIDDQYGWLLGCFRYGYYGSIGRPFVLRTTDGGKTWQHVYEDYVERSFAPYGLFFLDRQTGWMYDHSFGRILRTDDGGTSWVEQRSGYPYIPIEDLCFVNSEVGYAVGSAGQLLTTTNGGATWEQQTPLASGELHDVEMISCSRGWIGGEVPPHEDVMGHPLLFEAVEGEFTTNTMTTLGVWGHSIERLAAAESANAWAVGEYGFGAKWAAPTSATVLQPRAIPEGRVGYDYSQMFTVEPPNALATYSICGGMLPPGLTLDSGGLLSGEPTDAATYRFLVAADIPDDVGASRWFLLKIHPAASPSITTRWLPDGTVGQAYDAALSASGTQPPYEWFSEGGPGAPGLDVLRYGHIAGVPTAPGTWQIGVRVQDGQSPSASAVKTLSVTIHGALAGPSIYDIINYLLKRTTDPTGLDINADGAIDMADVLFLIAGAR